MKKVKIVLTFAFAFSACTFYDNFEIDQMHDATADIENRSSGDDSGSKKISGSEETKSSSSSVKSSFNCGSNFTDSRDKATYATVKIGSQCWFAENLNYAVQNSICFDDVYENCNKYGRLYRWSEAQSACPEGSRLPTQSDWEELDAYLGNAVVAGKYLKAEDAWDNAEDAFGFGALPAGYYNADEEESMQQGAVAYFWSLTETGTDAYARILKNNTNNLEVRESPKTNKLSVRCLID